MSAQLTYELAQPTAYAGLVYALSPSDIISRAIETAAGAAFGIAVSRGTDTDKEAVIGGATGYLGITIRSLEREGAANTGDIEYSQYEAAGIIRDGYVWANCPAGCVPGDLVFYNDTTGILDAGTAGVGETQIDGATWETNIAATGLAVIRLTNTTTTAGS